MITVSKADATVIKECTILSAYTVSGAIAAIPDVAQILQDDLRQLHTLESSELVDASKRLVSLTIQYAQSPCEPLQAQAKAALNELADLLLRTKEVK